jgi:aspartyl-tRNA(Asn)/glutamyl-tRNA(Gln) amidotransferase subunit C
VSTVTRQDVQRLASLARLELTEEETDLFTRQLGDILEFVHQIQMVDTSGLERVAAGGGPAGLREDVVRPSLERREVLAAAPEADAAAGLFKVPRVLNG